MTKIQLHESSFGEGVATMPSETPGRARVRVITPGWGSSGYYGADTLEAAGNERIFPAGTHMYVNHPSSTEAYDRPERDVKDLAAVLLEDATWDPANPGLWAEATIFSHWREPLAEMAPYIGVSIRGAAEVAEGEAEGRKGRIITRLIEGSSVDFVTKAGRGGGFEILESAWAAGHSAAPVSEASSNDTRERLRDLVNDAHRVSAEDYADSTYAWVRDFDTDSNTVWFELEGATNGIFQQAYTTDAEGLPSALAGARIEVTVRTEYVPVAPAGQSTTTQESQEDTMPQIEEARLRQLETDASRATELETQLAEARQREEAAATQLAEARRVANEATAVRIVNEAFTEANVTAPRTAARIAAGAPLNESGVVDEDALRAAAQEAAAELAEAGGAGRVTALGGNTQPTDTEDLSESELDAELAKLSGRTVKEA